MGFEHIEHGMGKKGQVDWIELALGLRIDHLAVGIE
jgi:hypothetical protein